MKKNLIVLSIIFCIISQCALGHPGEEEKEDHMSYQPTIGELVSFHDGQSGGEAVTLRLSDGKCWVNQKKDADRYCHPIQISTRQIWRKDKVCVTGATLERMIWQLNFMIACH